MRRIFCVIIVTFLLFNEKARATTGTITSAATRQLRENAYTNSYSMWSNQPDYKRLGLNSCAIVGATVVVVGLLYLAPEDFTNWNKEEMSFKTIGSKWWKNVRTPPVFDQDDLFLNWIAHPYWGGIYYTGARGAGFNIPLSFTFSVICSSLFWEYGVESFAEVPSIQDLIITPMVGSVVGEGFYLMKRAIVANDYKILNSKALGYTIAFLVDPLNELADYLSGGHYVKNNAYSLQLSPTSFSMRFTF